jgi:RNA-binding protein YhbY
MAKVFMVTADELDQLVQSLELTKLQVAENATQEARFIASDLHRSFHYRVVRWVQDVAGHKST